MNRHEQEVMVSTNYTVIKADERILALILLELWHAKRLSAVMKWSNLDDKYHKTIIDALKSYNWRYKNELTIRKWHNLVPLTLRSTIASMIVWDTVTPTMEAQYIWLGSDNTAPANADLLLWSEQDRGAITNKFAEDNVAYLDTFFWSATVWWNTYLEAWIFVDWSASVDTWYLLSRILINETVGANETLTFNCSITIA